MSNVVMYTKPGCPYCAKAKVWYSENGISFTEKNAQDNRDFRQEMLGFSEGDPTVPVIVVDGQLTQVGWEGRG